MRNQMLNEGPLKTIIFLDENPQTGSEEETPARRVQVTCEDSVTVCEKVKIEGPCTVISSDRESRIETYADVTLLTDLPPFGTFILSSGDLRLMVLAPDADTARLMHPEEDVTWNKKKGAWYFADGEPAELDGYTWAAPKDVTAQHIGDDAYAEIEERLHFWREE